MEQGARRGQSEVGVALLSRKRRTASGSSRRPTTVDAASPEIGEEQGSGSLRRDSCNAGKTIIVDGGGGADAQVETAVFADTSNVVAELQPGAA